MSHEQVFICGSQHGRNTAFTISQFTIVRTLNQILQMVHKSQMKNLQANNTTLSNIQTSAFLAFDLLPFFVQYLDERMELLQLGVGDA